MNFVKLHRKPLIDGKPSPILLNLDDVSGFYADMDGGSVVVLRRHQTPLDYADHGFFSVAEELAEMQKIIAALQGAIPEKDNITPLTVSRFIDFLYSKPEDRADG